MKIYIAGPISGTNDYSKRFYEAAAGILNKGHEPVNPTDLAMVIPLEGPNAITYSQTMTICKALLGACDAIYMMPGWQKSNGARQEHDEAVNKGLKFFNSISAIPETMEARQRRIEKRRQEAEEWTSSLTTS